jgi:hypothetical protein
MVLAGSVKKVKLWQISLLFNDTGIIEQTKNDTIFNQPILKTDTVKALLKIAFLKIIKISRMIMMKSLQRAKGILNCLFEQMKRIVESDKFIIIDARQPEAYQTAHIPNSINIFAYEEESTLIPKIYHFLKIKQYCIL